MEKKVLLKDLVSTGTHIRTEFMPRAVVSDNGEYQIGEFWDANKTIDVIVNNSHKQHDNIRELDEYTHAEETRAKAAEASLDAKITAEVTARKADVDAEESRATAAEQALDAAKANIADLAAVATSGDYNDLINVPDIAALIARIEDLEQLLAQEEEPSEPEEPNEPEV